MGSFFSSLSNPVDDSSPSDLTNVIAVHSYTDWMSQLNKTKEFHKLMVVAFSASWGGPCAIMLPVLQGMAQKWTDVDFVKIDVDEVSDLAKEFSVEVMPTIVMMMGGEEVDRVVGAKVDELEKMVESNRQKFAT